MLAIHPINQQHVFDELLERFGNDRDPEITRDDVESLKYLEWSIKETMRLFPMVAIISRQNIAPIDIKGTTIPPGTSLAVNIQRVHRDQKYWGADADIFKPSRFDPKNFNNINQYCYLAFSGGPRHCVGMYTHSTYIFLFLLKKYFAIALCHIPFCSTHKNFKRSY